jgi:hypothetical protein
MRSSGYYWLKLTEDSNIWSIGEYNAKFDTWMLCGIDIHYKDKHFFFISPYNILTP